MSQLIDPFTSQVIPATPIPILNTTNSNSQPGAPTVSNVSSDSLEPTTIGNQPLTLPTISADVIGPMLDTQNRQIKGKFTFNPIGAFRVGQYTPGVSGEIDISDLGIIVIDQNNNTVVAIDDLGNASFKGQLLAGNIITGAIKIQTGGSVGDNSSTAIIDSTGVNSLNQFPNGSVTQGSTQTTTNTGFQDVPGVSVSFTLARTANVLVLLDGTGLNTANLSGNDNCIVTLNVDGVDQAKQMSLPGYLSGGGGLFGTSGSLSYLLQLAAGAHTLKMRFRSVNGGTAEIVFATLTYDTLGK